MEGGRQEKRVKVGNEKVQQDMGEVTSYGAERTTKLDKDDYYRLKFTFNEVILSASRGRLWHEPPPFDYFENKLYDEV